MPNYFVDSTTGSDLDDGTTMDLAWESVKHAVESGGLVAGDKVWVRRIHAEPAFGPGAISLGYTGTVQEFIEVIGWPRAADASITSATFTNGSTTVDLIVGLSMDRDQHLGRLITAPDGELYQIVKVTDSNTVEIDMKYVGTTVTGVSGACTINEDESYDESQLIVDTTWTIKVADWTADADDIATIDMGGIANYWYQYNDNYWAYRSIEFADSTYTNGVFYHRGSRSTIFQGVILSGNEAQSILYYVAGTGTMVMDRVILDGLGSSTGMYVSGCADFHARFFSVGGIDVQGVLPASTGNLHFERSLLNVVDPGQYGVELQAYARHYFKDCRFGGSVSNFLQDDKHFITVPYWVSENHEQVLGAHVAYWAAGSVTKNDVVLGSGDPEKRATGADSVLDIQFDQNVLNNSLWNPMKNWQHQPVLFTHRFEATTDSKSYRYYVQAEGAVSADELWLECSYVSAADGTTEYVFVEVNSDESMDARDDAGDWSQYIEVTGIAPAIASTVTIKLCCRYYHATNNIYVDPLPEIT